MPDPSSSSSMSSSSSSSRTYPRTIYNLPENLTEIISNPITHISPEVDHKWRYFNRLHHLWEALNDASGINNIISPNDVPEEPKVSDFYDLSEPED